MMQMLNALDAQTGEPAPGDLATDWPKVKLGGYAALLAAVRRLEERIARLEQASGMPIAPAVVRRVVVDFGHGWQVVAEDADGDTVTR